MFKRIFILLTLLLFQQSSFAQTKFVTDEFEVMLRTGPSIQNKIIRALQSGTQLEILREDAGNGHSQVQTSRGEIGYLITRFISDKPSARSRLSYLENQLNQLRSNPDEIRSLLAASQDENLQLITQNTALTDQLTRIQQELEGIKKVSGDAINLASQNKQLNNEVQQLLLQLDDIRIQNEDLIDQSDRINKFIGAGLIVLGLFLGWILSISGRRNQNTWGS